MPILSGSYLQTCKVGNTVTQTTRSGHNFANYRPVSKILEHYVDNNGYNDAFQSAYRQRHSTETALIRIHNDMMQSMDCHRGVLLVLLDLSAAFDTLNHGILLKRLHDIGVRHTMFDWFT